MAQPYINNKYNKPKNKIILSQSHIKRFVWDNLCDSQLVYRFSMPLHFYASCSHRVHKSCSHRIFDLHEFK